MKCVEFLNSRIRPLTLVFALAVSSVLGFVSCDEDGTKSIKPVEYSGEVQKGDAVDLGLSVRWAGCNLGATSPEDMGSLYAWGETSAREASFVRDKYALWDGVAYKSYGKEDGLVRLDYAQDVAGLTLGDGWRLPSQSEIRELVDNCKWTFATYKGVKGYVVTADESKGGQSIFLPMTGYISGDTHSHKDVRGLYWGCQLTDVNSDYGVTMFLNDEGSGSGMMHRYYGAAVRPVCVLGPDSAPSSQRVMPDVAALLRGSDAIGDIVWTSTSKLADGVIQTDLVLSTTEGFAENIHFVTVDLKADGIHMKVATPDNSKDIPSGKWPQQTLSAMAAGLDSDADQVLAMVNASFWNTTSITPRGPVHSDGTVMWSNFQPTSSGHQGVSYVGYTTDGVLKIDQSDEYNVSAPGLYSDVTGSGLMLVKQGKAVQSFVDVSREPRTAIGCTGDGYVFLMTADGRNPGIADGLTHVDMARIFAALGCVSAVNEDGGGSAQMLVKDPGTGSFTICNHPSDGAERAVIDAWAVMKK